MKRIYGKTINDLMIDYFNKLSPSDVFTTQDMKDYFIENYPKISLGSVPAYLVKFSTNSKSRIHWTLPKDGKCDLLFKINQNQYRLYDKNNDPPPIHENNNSSSDSVSEDDFEDDFESSQEFAYEKDLQNYLSKNLQIIENGLKIFEEDDINGIEFPAGNRLIDILAVDKNGDFVIIELKVSRGYDRVIGQLLRYIGWVDKNLAKNKQKVRGIIICKEISDDLLLACSKIKDVELFEYELSIKLNKKYIE